MLVVANVLELRDGLGRDRGQRHCLLRGAHRVAAELSQLLFCKHALERFLDQSDLVLAWRALHAGGARGKFELNAFVALLTIECLLLVRVLSVGSENRVGLLERAGLEGIGGVWVGLYDFRLCVSVFAHLASHHLRVCRVRAQHLPLIVRYLNLYLVDVVLEVTFFASAVWEDHAPVAMLDATDPFSLVTTAVSPVHLSVSFPFIVFIFTLVDVSTCPCELPEAALPVV